MKLLSIDKGQGKIYFTLVSLLSIFILTVIFLIFLMFSLLLIQSFQCENQYARKNGRNKINGRMPSMKIYLHLIMCTQLNNYRHSIAQTAFSVIQFG